MTKLQPTAEFFNTDEFAENATYKNPSGATSTIPVIFDKEYLEMNFGGTSFESVGPIALIQSSDCPGINNKAQLTIGGTLYYVKEVHPSATGITMVKLSKDAV
jgi:hypothetical protein